MERERLIYPSELAHFGVKTINEVDGMEMSKRAQRDYKKLQKRWAAYGDAVNRYAKSNLVME